MGMVTGIGGGMVRDLLAGRVPVIFSSELYATPALAGAAWAVFAHEQGWALAAVALPGDAALLRLAGAGDHAELAGPGRQRSRQRRAC